jgi:hypothetical protein
MSNDDGESLIVNGRAVNPVLLEARPMSRCRLEECQSYCCNGGVWIHNTQADDILAHQDLILPHMPPDRRDPSQWFDGLSEPDIDFPEAGDAMGTSVVPDPTHPAGQTCIFLNAERLCVLQKAGIEAGEHPWRFKPYYCALHPLGLDEMKLELEEESEVYKAGGNCSRPSGDLIPLYQLFDIEAKLFLGEEGYAELDRIAQARRIAA